ncbi:MAG: NUDIX hydrolase [Christensenellaceae bacterium]|nr:NUDIX hydrolase [Christensenellaceae bacterium]
METFLDGKVVFPGKIIRVEHWQVRLPSGETALREVACHPGASAVVPLDEDGNVILVRQHRIAVGRLTLEIPAGKLDSPEEDPLFCAKRELSEETGYIAQSWEKLTCLETTPGFCNERIHVYLATGLSRGETHPDEDEFVATVRMPLKEAVDHVMRGEFRDSKTALGLMMAAYRLAH